MRIRLTELRTIIRGVLREAQDASTISSELSPDEKEFQEKYPKWGSPRAQKFKQSSPGSVKAKQVAKILAAKGLTADAGHKKAVTQQLLPFIEKMDPAELFIADPDDIATEFATQVLGVKKD